MQVSQVKKLMDKLYTYNDIVNYTSWLMQCSDSISREYLFWWDEEIEEAKRTTIRIKQREGRSNLK
jgi:uncharacterized protein involved in tolerance to divalent cations